MTIYQKLLTEIKQLDRDSQLKVRGFLDALLWDDVTATNLKAATSQSATSSEIIVAYASQSGNAESIAKNFVTKLQHLGHIAKLTSVADINLKKMANWTRLIMVVSTHGEGEPPDIAITFSEQLKGKRAPKLDRLQYAVVSLGDSSYEQFCEYGKWIDSRLAELGAKSITTRLDCDVDYEDDLASWSEDLLDELTAQRTEVVEAVAAADMVSQELYSFKNPFDSEVISVVNLCTDDADKKVFHLELDALASAISYEPGDSLGVRVLNPQELVNNILQHIGVADHTVVSFAKKEISIKEALHHTAEIFRLTSKQLKQLVSLYPNKDLEAIIADEVSLSEFIFTNDVFSIIKYYPVNFVDKAQAFIDVLNPQVQRLYSISSSPQTHEDEIHLTVRLREFGEEHRMGLVSGSIASLSEGDKIKIFLKNNNNFRLPQDPKVPIIMIGAGTGVAPFRGFLYERLELNTVANSWLFFGEQNFRQSFLYQTDWLKLLEGRALTKLSVAFSRDKENKQYVQEKLLENAQEVYEWIEQGAVIYVCGSADTMAPAVHESLANIISKQGKVDENLAQQRLQKMLSNGLYKRDVY